VRLPRVLAGLPPGSAKPADGAPRSGPAGHPLFGGWSATRWQYSSAADPARTVDVVTDLSGSITLSLAATAFILAFDIGGREKHSVSGTCEVRGDELLLVHEGTDREERVAFHQIGDTLSLRSDASGWDFDGKGQDQNAAFVAVLVRL
jgi:hypothetical protein